MSSTTPWKNPEAIAATLAEMADSLERHLCERGIDAPIMVGIHTGGVWVAEALHDRLGLSEPLGQLDISFYRDDFSRIGMHPEVKRSTLPVAVDGRHLILVDDVLQSGRTIRAALNVLFDYGRPDSVTLAVLVERDGRELPIEPQVVGLRARLGAGEQIKLSGPDPLVLERGNPPSRRRKPETDATGTS